MELNIKTDVNKYVTKYKVDHLLVKTDDDNMKIKEGKKKEKTNIRSSPSTINNTYQSSHPGDVIMIDGKKFKVIDIGKPLKKYDGKL